MNERELFLSALEIDDLAARSEFVRSACGDNAELLVRVEALLESNDGQSEFLNTPAMEQILLGSNGDTEATVFHDNDHSTNEAEGLTRKIDGLASSGDCIDDQPVLELLEPSQRADSLGRLSCYEILEVIGRGAFGTVLRAFDEKLQRVVAIKIMAPDLAATSPARKRFQREARASAKVRHENVVAIYDVNDKPIPFLVMEYIDGETLQQRLDSHGPLELSDVLRIGKQLADGLVAAHAQGLIHRDIKPGNILLETSIDDRVKITDFGLARTADDASMTQSGMIAGTPMYMAPEQAHGKKLDQRADLFSLGSVLYQMLSGRPPFRAPNTMAVLKRVTEDAPRPIQEIIPEVPTWMSNLVAHLHAKEPDQRYNSAHEVSELLGQCLADVKAGRKPKIAPPVVQRVSQTISVPSASRFGHRPLVKVAAAVLITLLVGLAFGEATGVATVSDTVTRLVYGSGTLVIEVNDPNVKVTIDGEEIRVSGPGIAEFTVRPGDIEIEAFRNGKRVEHELATVSRNGRTVVRIHIESLTDPKAAFPPGSAAYLLTSDEYEWTEWENLGSEINSQQKEEHPWVSPDGLTLLFSSARLGGEGGVDIYQCTRANIREAWSPPENLGSPINSKASESGPQMSPDGLELFFLSDGGDRIGEGSSDVWVSRRDSTESPWKDPVNLGAQVNSPQWDGRFSLSTDGRQLAFVSKRGGDWHMWKSTRRSAGGSWGNAKQIAAALSSRIQFLDSNQTFLFGGTLKDEVKPLKVGRWTSEPEEQATAELDLPNDDKFTVMHHHFCRATNELFFVSNRPGGEGESDIWVTRRVRKEKLVAELAAQHEWIDVIPLIDPQLDKWEVEKFTGKNQWRIEGGELFVGQADNMFSKLLLPLEINSSALECEIEFTRLAGDTGVCINLPKDESGDYPVAVDPLHPDHKGRGGLAIGRGNVVITTDPQLETGERTTFRVEVHKLGGLHRITIWLDGKKRHEWTGRLSSLDGIGRGGYPRNRRVGLWCFGQGTELVFHRIRLRMLDGGTAKALRSTPASKADEQSTNALMFDGTPNTRVDIPTLNFDLDNAVTIEAICRVDSDDVMFIAGAPGAEHGVVLGADSKAFRFNCDRCGFQAGISPRQTECMACSQRV